MIQSVLLRTLKAVQNPVHPQIFRAQNSKSLNFNVGNSWKIRHTDFSTLNVKFEEEHTAEEVETLCNDHGTLKEPNTNLYDINPQSILVNPNTYASLLQHCAQTKAVEDGRNVHAHMIKTGFEQAMFAGNNLVNMYAKCGSLTDARQVFDKMFERNVVSWASVIAAYVQQGHAKEALKLFSAMQLDCIWANEFSVSSILKACSSIAALEAGHQLHAYIVKVGFGFSSFVVNALLDMYAKCGSIENARTVFDEIGQRDVVSWNSMIAGYARGGFKEEALQLFGHFQREDLKWDCTTLATVVGVCTDLLALEVGKQLHSQIAKTRSDCNVFVGSALLDMYAKCGSADDAGKVFDRMPVHNVVSWTAMISGHAQQGNAEETIKLFIKMPLAGLKADEFTYAIVLSACGMLSSLKQGMQLHGQVLKSGFLLYVLVGNALVDMYAKSGSIENAHKVFDQMIQRDVVSWNSMIASYAQHGHGKEALQLFQQMQREKLVPNNVTFVGVLSACSHEGLLDEGCYYFDCMSKHGVTAGMEHYTCMIVLLGRAGRLAEAEEFVNHMPFEPDIVAWRTLLSACRDHSNMEIGTRIAERILKLEPQDTGTYMLLSNIYAAAGRWDQVSKVRKLMKDRGVKKEPGLSWIEVRNRVHAFTVGDRSHPQTKEIYAKLERLTEQMKEEGYAPNVTHLLLDLEQE
jgi:pentatricopeptide repeat protein